MARFILRAAIVSAMVCLLLPVGLSLGWMTYRVLSDFYYRQPAQTPQAVSDQQRRRCLIVGGWDDAYDKVELVYVVVSLDNLARELKKHVCDVYRDADTIRAPSQPLHILMKLLGREVDIVEAYAKTRGKAWYSEVEKFVNDYLSDPTEVFNQYPEASCMKRYIKSRNKALSWTDEAAMGGEMRLVVEHRPIVENQDEISKFFCKPRQQ